MHSVSIRHLGYHVITLHVIDHGARVHNPKNQLSQINSSTTVGRSLEYSIAKFTLKPEVRLLSSASQNFIIANYTRCTIYFKNFVFYTKDQTKFATKPDLM